MSFLNDRISHAVNRYMITHKTCSNTTWIFIFSLFHINHNEPGNGPLSHLQLTLFRTVTFSITTIILFLYFQVGDRRTVFSLFTDGSFTLFPKRKFNYAMIGFLVSVDLYICLLLLWWWWWWWCASCCDNGRCIDVNMTILISPPPFFSSFILDVLDDIIKPNVDDLYDTKSIVWKSLVITLTNMTQPCPSLMLSMPPKVSTYEQ